VLKEKKWRNGAWQLRSGDGVEAPSKLITRRQETRYEDVPTYALAIADFAILPVLAKLVI